MTTGDMGFYVPCVHKGQLCSRQYPCAECPHYRQRNLPQRSTGLMLWVTLIVIGVWWISAFLGCLPGPDVALPPDTGIVVRR
jgi:hypothetical protein